MDIQQIKQAIPHRYPFLLVDKIIEIGDSHAIGIKNVTYNEPFFQGHFPKLSVMPGVLIIEAMAQVGAAALLSRAEHSGKVVFLAGINNARFREMVVPGDQLHMRVDFNKLKGRLGKASATATVDGKKVVEAEFSFVVGAE